MPKKSSQSKLWIFSDLHLENSRFPEAYDPTPPDFDILVCAGDIWESNTQKGFALLRRLAGDKPVIAVLGNHEHWNNEPSRTLKQARQDAEEYDIDLLEGDEVNIDGIRFVGTTLWSDYEFAGDLADPLAYTGEHIAVLEDGKDSPLTISDAIMMHKAAKTRLTEQILSHEGQSMPLVVVTHNAPHFVCVPKEHRGTWRAGNDASDLSELTDIGLVDLWINGHIHTSHNIIRPNGTRIIRNPAGRHFDNPDFDESYMMQIAY